MLAINTISFLVMMLDKLKSRKKDEERIPEGLLFFLAVAFGSVGVYLGMLVFRHKTQKWYFSVGIPLLMIQNYATFHLAYLLLEKRL